MLQRFRIFILLFILANVAFGAWLTKTQATNWNQALNVIMFVINGDGSAAAQDYIDALKARDDDELDVYFSDIETFFEREGSRHKLELEAPINM